MLSDETYIRVKGKWVYLYWAVDSSGATIDFLLSAKRDATAAERFLAKALSGENHPALRVMNTDEHAGYPPAIERLKSASVLVENCRHRPVQYLNNVLEQDRRASNAGCAQANIFVHSGELGARSPATRHPYDPQRLSVLECGGHEGWSTAPLHSRSVRRHKLNYRSSTPTFGSTTKLQHFPQSGSRSPPDWSVAGRQLTLKYSVFTRSGWVGRSATTHLYPRQGFGENGPGPIEPLITRR